MRRFTRLTNAHSKKLQNHLHSLSLHFTHHNFVKVNQTLNKTPAMAAGLTDRPYDYEWIIGLINEREPKPNRPERYRTVNHPPNEKEHIDEDGVQVL